MLGLALALALAAPPPTQVARAGSAPRAVYRVLWQRDLSTKVMLEWHPVELGGAAYDPVTKLVVAGTRDGWLHALRQDGTIAWEFMGQGAFSGPPEVNGDTVYAGCDDGRLYALAVATGKERWHYDAKEQLATRPAVLDGLVFVASLQDTVFAVDAGTGAWRWHNRREQRDGFTIHGAASVAVAGGLVHAGFSDGTVVALEAATGVTRWERHAAPSGDYTDVDSLVVSDGKVFAAAYSGAVVALEAATGKPLWQFETPEAARVAMAPGTLIAVSSRSIFALSPQDGRVLWTTPLQGSPAGAPRAAGRWLLVPGGAGGLNILELASGRLVRIFNPGDGISASPVVHGKLVFLMSNAGRIGALELL